MKTIIWLCAIGLIAHMAQFVAANDPDSAYDATNPTNSTLCSSLNIELKAPVDYETIKDKDLFAQTATVTVSVDSDTWAFQGITVDDATVGANERLPSFLRKDSVIKAKLSNEVGQIIHCPVANPTDFRARGAILEHWGSNRAVLDDYYGNHWTGATLAIANDVCPRLPNNEKTQLKQKTNMDDNCQRNKCPERQDECALNSNTMNTVDGTSSNPLSTFCTQRQGHVGETSEFKHGAELNTYSSNGDAIYRINNVAYTRMSRGAQPQYVRDLSNTESVKYSLDIQTDASAARHVVLDTGILSIENNVTVSGREWMRSQAKTETRQMHSEEGHPFLTPGTAASPQDFFMNVSISRRTPGGYNDTNVQQWSVGAPALFVYPRKAPEDFEANGCDQTVPVDFAVVEESVLADCNKISDNGEISKHTQLREPSYTNVEVHVCISENDQSDLLAPDDRFDGITKYFKNGGLSFQMHDTKNTADSSDDSSVDIPLNHPNYKFFESTDDKQVCFIMSMHDKPPTCTCESDTQCTNPTNPFGGKATGSAHNKDVQKSMAAPEGFTCGADESRNTRVITASISDRKGMCAFTALNADISALTDGVVDDQTVNGNCKYSTAIQSTQCLQVESRKHLRIKAKAGLQKQIALRIGVYAQYKGIDLTNNAEHKAAWGLNGNRYDRVSVRSALSMVAFQPYKSGVCSHSQCGSLLDKVVGNVELPAYTNEQQSNAKNIVQEVPLISDTNQYGPKKTVFNNAISPLTFNSKLGDVNGCVAWEYASTTQNDSSMRLAETTRIDFRIKEITTCTYKNVRSTENARKYSAEERHWFGATCINDDTGSNLFTSEGRVVRTMFSSSYKTVDFDFALYEYGCQNMEHHYFIDGATMELLETTRKSSTDTWAEVINEIIKNIQVKFPYDYSTQMCGDIKFDAYVSVQDVRACGKPKEYDLQSGNNPFAQFTISTKSASQLTTGHAKPVSFNAQIGQGGPSIITSQPAGDSRKFLTLYYPHGSDRHVTSQTPVSQNHIFTFGDSDNESSNAPPRSTRTSAISRDDGVLDYNVNTRWQQSRDHDHVSSLEITDYTDIVSNHDYHTGNTACAYDSDILTLVKQANQDDNVMHWSNMTQLKRLNDAAFVMSHCFTLDGTNATAAESAASHINRGFAYQMIHGKTEASQAANMRKFRRYSIFASVDTFAIASGIDADVQQGCVPCSTLLTLFNKNAFFQANANVNKFVAQCERSRKSMFGTGTYEDGCPEANAFAFDGTNFARGSFPLLSTQFPAFVTRPGSRDPHRLSVSLDVYDWINRNTQTLDQGMDVTRFGKQFFTVAPQGISAVYAIDSVPLHDDDFKCSLSWDTTKSNTTHIAYRENGNTGDDLKFQVTAIAKSHYNGVKTVSITDTENFNYGTSDSTKEYAFQQNNNCVSPKVCLKPCDTAADFDSCTKVGGNPVNKTHNDMARVSLARLLTNLDGHAAQSESLDDNDNVNRCAQRSWKKHGVNSSLDVVQALDPSLISSILHATQNLDLSDLNTVVHKHLETNRKGVYVNDAQRQITHCQEYCVGGDGCGSPNVTNAYSLRYDTQFGVNNYRNTVVFPSGERSEFHYDQYGSFVQPDCQNLKSYTAGTLSNQPDHGNTYSHTKNTKNNFNTQLNFINDYNSDARQPFLADESNQHGCVSSADFLSFGMQVAMTSESKTRDEYKGGSVTVSSCQNLPALSSSISDQSTHRNLYVNSMLPAGDAHSKSMQVRFPSTASHNTQWRDSSSKNTVVMFEADQYNMPSDRTRPSSGTNHSERSDGYALTVAFDFLSKANYQDLRPVSFTMDITKTDGGHQINDLFDAYIVLDDINNAGNVWTNKMTQVSSDTHQTFNYYFNTVDRPNARFMPTQKAIGLIGKTSCMYLMTVDDHNPSNNTDVKYMTEVVNIGTSQWSSLQACHKIKIVPKTTNLGLDRITVKTCATVKDSGSSEIQVKDCTQKDIEVVNVAGQPLQCAARHTIHPHQPISSAHPLVASAPVCNHVASSSYPHKQVMASDKWAVIAQSTHGRIPSFVRLVVDVASTTFSQSDNFHASSGKINLNDQLSNKNDYDAFTGNNDAIKEMYKIRCEFNTTCKMYGETAYLNIVADNDIQVGRVFTVNGENSILRYTPLTDNAATQTIKNWANAADSTSYSKTYLSATPIGDFTAVSALSDNAVKPAPESHNGAQGGKMFRIRIANSSVICSGNGNTDCTVGYQLSGDDEQVNNLVYAAGSEIAENIHINLKMFVTTFTYEEDKGIGVMSIDADGAYTRSGTTEWQAKVLTTADIGGVCTHRITLGQNEHNVNYFKDFMSKSKDELKDLTPNALVNDLIAGGADDKDTADNIIGASVANVNDLQQNGTHYRDVVFEINDDTIQNAATQSIKVSVSRLVMTRNTTSRYGYDEDVYSLVSGSTLECTNLVDKQRNHCNDDEINGSLNATIKLGLYSSSVKLSLKIKKSADVNDDDVGNDLMACIALDTVGSNINKVVDTCKEVCFIAVDPDAESTTSCVNDGCSSGVPIGFVDEQTLSSVTCTSDLANEADAKRLWIMKNSGRLDASAATITNKVQEDIPMGAMASIISIKESQLVSSGIADFSLSTNSVTVTQSPTRPSSSMLPTSPSDVDSDKLSTLRFQNFTIHTVETPVLKIKENNMNSNFNYETLNIETRSISVKLAENQQVATDQLLANGVRCHAMAQHNMNGQLDGCGCPFTEVLATDAFGDVCNTFRTKYAAEDANCFSNGPTVCYGSVTSDCENPGLRKVQTLETVFVGSLSNKPDNSSNLQSKLWLSSYDSCSNGQKNQHAGKVEKCDGDDAMAGVYTFVSKHLWSENSDSTCKAENGITLELDSSLLDTDAVTIENVILDTGSNQNYVCLHDTNQGGKQAMLSSNACSSPSTNALELTRTGNMVTVKAPQSAVDSLCQWVTSKTILHVTLKGKFGISEQASGNRADRYISLAFAESKALGNIQIDTGNTVVDEAKMREGANDAMKIQITRSGGASDNLNNFLKVSNFDTNPDSTDSADVWVSLKVCTRNVIQDALGYEIKTNNSYIAMMSDPLTRLSGAKDVCAYSYVKIPNGVASVDAFVKTSRTQSSSGICGAASLSQCETYSASLCLDVETMSNCIVLKDDPSTLDHDVLDHKMRTLDNFAKDKIRQWKTQGDNNQWSLEDDGRIIRCNPIQDVTNCGFKQGGCIDSDVISWVKDDHSANSYTSMTRSGLDATSPYAVANSGAKHNVKLNILNTTNTYCIAVESNSVSMDAASCIGDVMADQVNVEEQNLPLTMAGCAVSSTLYAQLNKTSADCPRIKCFKATTNAVSVDITAVKGLTSFRIDHLHLFKACDESTCQPHSNLDKYAIVVLPMADNNFDGAHGMHHDSHANMGFGLIRYNANDKIVVDFDLGEYRPSNTDNSCLDSLADGIGDPTAPEHFKNRCKDWGDATNRHKEGRGFSPQMCTLQLGIGKSLVNDKADTDTVFGQDTTDLTACSLTRGVGTNWPTTGVDTTKKQFATTLFEEPSQRKTCADLDNIGNGNIYDSNTIMYYRGFPKDSDPALNFNLSLRTDNATSPCSSKYKVSGNIHVSLEKARSCHHVGKGNTWVPIATQYIENQGKQNEAVNVKFPVTMRCYRATKATATHANINVKEDVVTTQVQVYTNTFKGSKTTSVKSTNLPSVYLHDVTPVIADPPTGDTTYNGKLVHTECFNDCQREISQSQSGCKDACATECQRVYDSDGNEIPGSFGKLEVTVTVETLHGNSGFQPFTGAARTFKEIGDYGIGAPMINSIDVIDMEPQCPHRVFVDSNSKKEATMSKLKITSVTKRLVKVTQDWKDFDVPSKSGKGLRIEQGVDIMPDELAFKRTPLQCGCSFMPMTSTPAHPRCTFHEATDFAFQILTRSCVEGAVQSVGMDNKQCIDPTGAHSAKCTSAGAYRTVQLKIEYENNQQFINKQEIVTSMNELVSQGQLANSAPDGAQSSNPLSLTLADAQSFVDNTTLKSGDRLQQGKPLIMVQEVLDGLQKLGRDWQLHTENAITAIHADECDDQCGTNGYRKGQCGTNPDGTTDILSRHVLAKVILPGTMPNNLNTRPLSENRELIPFWKDTQYYKTKVSAVLTNYTESLIPGGGNLINDYDLCFTASGNLDNVMQAQKSIGTWCVGDNLKSVWDGAEAVTAFLDKARYESCRKNNRVLLCPFTTDSSKFCYVLDTLDRHNGMLGHNLCMGSEEGATGFKDFFRIMEVVMDYKFQSAKVASENYVAGHTLPVACHNGITQAQPDKYQMGYMNTGLSTCNQLHRGVFASVRSNVQKHLDDTHQEDSIVTNGNDRLGQCLGAAKSVQLTSNALKNNEKTFKDRSALRQDVKLPESYITPCVRTVAYMESRVTDTRTTCGTPLVYKDGNSLKVKNPLPIKGSSTSSPLDASIAYPLYYDDKNECDHNSGKCSKSLQYGSRPVYFPPVVKFCSDKADTAEESLEKYNALFWAHGNMMYKTGGKYYPLYAAENGTTFKSVPANEVCTGRRSIAVDKPKAPSSASRGMLTVQTSTSLGATQQQIDLRRSETASSEISIVTTVSLGTGAYQTATCQNMNTCHGPYVYKANAENLRCNDNSNNECNLSYCCDVTSITYITVRADCTSLNSSHTQLRMVFTSSMTVAIFAIILIIGQMTAVYIKQYKCNDPIEMQRLCKKPTIIIALEMVSVIMLLLSAIIGISGQSDGGWIETCGLDNNIGWPVWIPLLLAALMSVYCGYQYCGERSKCDQGDLPTANAGSILYGQKKVKGTVSVDLKSVRIL